MNALIGFGTGLVFGIGLLYSGMTNPANILAFLDVTGAWDVRLALVMVGAIAIAAPAFAWMRHYRHTLRGERVDLPSRTDVTRRLVGGSAVFGIGWGLAGLCPGPALVLAGTGSVYAVAFVAAMGIGLLISPARRDVGGVHRGRDDR